MRRNGKHRRWVAWLWVLPILPCLVFDLVSQQSLWQLMVSLVASAGVLWTLVPLARGKPPTTRVLAPALLAVLASALCGLMSHTLLLTPSWLAVVLIGFLVQRARLLPATLTALMLLLAPLQSGDLAPMLTMAMATAIATAAALGSTLRAQADTAARVRVEAINAERRRMAAELHDVIAHEVTGIIVLAQAAQSAQSAQPARATQDARNSPGGPDGLSAPAFARIEEAGVRAMSQIRAMVATLRAEAATDASESPDPTARERANLPDQATPLAPLVPTPQGLTGVADAVAAHRGPVTFEADPMDDSVVDSPSWLLLARATTEGLTNVRRHAGATVPAHVRLRDYSDSIVLTVRDEGGDGGVGGGSGSGLVGLRERARTVGGSVEAGPTQGDGWLLTVQAPRAARRPAPCADDRPAMTAREKNP